MARWEPDARQRLEEAAMDLYRERGFAETTVAEIAARAGLTERTFFRHFADKREVLFSGTALFERAVVEGIAGAPGEAAPLEAVSAGFAAVSPFFEQRRERAKLRSALLRAHDELREREVMKLHSLGAAIAGALRGRGLREPAASLAAEAGVGVFKVAFERWLEDPEARGLPHHLEAALGELRGVVGPGAATARAPSTGGRGRRPGGARKTR